MPCSRRTGARLSPTARRRSWRSALMKSAENVNSHHGPMLFRLLRCEGKPRLHGRRGGSRNARRNVLADGRPMFESVTGAAARDPDVVEGGMPVDDKIAV